MVQSDALSRSILQVTKDNDIEKIMKLHIEACHRRDIGKLVKENKLEVTEKELKTILDNCIECAKKDKKRTKNRRFVPTNSVGEKIGIDLIELKRKRYAVVAIDYFSRKVFAKMINSKETKNTIKFMEYLKKEIKIKTLISDNGKEFANKEK